MSSSPTNASNANQTTFDNDSTRIQTSQSKRTRWGKTAFPITTTTMSLDEEITYNASKQNDDPSSMISPSGDRSMESKGSWFYLESVVYIHIYYTGEKDPNQNIGGLCRSETYEEVTLMKKWCHSAVYGWLPPAGEVRLRVVSATVRQEPQWPPSGHCCQ